jgi:hypothetical protein
VALKVGWFMASLHNKADEIIKRYYLYMFLT